MNIRRTITPYLLLTACLVFSVVSIASARTLDDIRQSMAQRAPIINSLKAKGIVGEDNRGYLAFLGSERIEQAVVDAENKDRNTVYRYFAQQQNTSLDVAEKNQAERKAKRARPGEFYQSADGTWHRK
ncbi:MAG: YdbL family protein [Desulfobacterales bacterium]|nr:YdbL family protein [Desulfobacterales bacterium]